MIEVFSNNTSLKAFVTFLAVLALCLSLTGQRANATPAVMPEFNNLFDFKVKVIKDSKGKGPFEVQACLTPLVDIENAAIHFEWNDTIELAEPPESFRGGLKTGHVLKWLIKGRVNGPVELVEGIWARPVVRAHIKFPFPYKAVNDLIENDIQRSRDLWGRPFSEDMFKSYLKGYKGQDMNYIRPFGP